MSELSQEEVSICIGEGKRVLPPPLVYLRLSFFSCPFWSFPLSQSRPRNIPSAPRCQCCIVFVYVFPAHTSIPYTYLPAISCQARPHARVRSGILLFSRSKHVSRRRSFLIFSIHFSSLISKNHKFICIFSLILKRVIKDRSIVCARDFDFERDFPKGNCIFPCWVIHILFSLFSIPQTKRLTRLQRTTYIMDAMQINLAL